MLGFGQQGRALVAAASTVVERRRLTAGRFLRDIADAHTRRRLDPSLIGLVDPGNELEQRGFAGAVAADQTDASLRRQRGRRAIEDEMAAEAQRDAVKREHDADLIACAPAQSLGLSGLPSWSASEVRP